jgi:hypothetical protein
VKFPQQVEVQEELKNVRLFLPREYVCLSVSVSASLSLRLCLCVCVFVCLCHEANFNFIKERYYNVVFKCIPGADDHCGICSAPISSVQFLTELRTTFASRSWIRSKRIREVCWLRYTTVKIRGCKQLTRMPSLNKDKNSHVLAPTHKRLEGSLFVCLANRAFMTAQLKIQPSDCTRQCLFPPQLATY